jgi:hypothetical protein
MYVDLQVIEDFQTNVLLCPQGRQLDNSSLLAAPVANWDGMEIRTAERSKVGEKEEELMDLTISL